MKYEIDKSRVPNHIGIIMDGNGRYAMLRNLPRTEGHKAGSENLKTIIRYAKDIGVKVVTVYAFSTENWKRPLVEVKGIMKLLSFYLGDWRHQLGDDNLKIKVIGDVSQLDAPLQAMISVVEKQTAKNDGLLLNIALAYGGRLEIVQAVKKIAGLCKSGKLLPEDITEEMISKYVYTSHVDDPELIIRTGGEIRTSNFLMWQSAYSEYYFTDVLWPEFSPEDLDKAIYTYQTKDRRFGGLNK